MSISKDDIPDNNQAALNQSGQERADRANKQLITKTGQLIQSNIGLSVGGVEVGMETLTSAKNKFEEAGGFANIGGVVESLSPEKALVSITENVPGLIDGALNIAGLGSFTTKSISTVFDSDGVPTTTESSSSNTLSNIILTITGLGLRSSSLDGFKDIVNITPDAQGVVSAASVLSGGDENIKSTLETVSGIDFTSAVGATIEAGIDVLTGNLPKSSMTQSVVLDAVSDAPTSILTLVPNIKNDISSATATVTDMQTSVNQVINNTEPGVGALQQSANQVDNETGDQPISSTDIQTTPSSNPDEGVSGARLISNNLSVTTQEAQEVFGSAYNIDNNNITSFEYISSVEELRSEIIGRVPSNRSTCVVHWTDSYLDQNIGSQEIDTYQKQLGHEGIQYHYVIRRNGVVQRGRNPQRTSTHTNTDHDNVSIAIAFVGGYNCPSGTKNPDRYRNVRSLTRAQFNSFEEICRTLYFKSPGIQIVGHNDIDPDQPDPGFDVIEYCNDIFGKESVFDGSVIPLNGINVRRLS